MPIKLLELELAETIHPLWGLERYDKLCVLVRYRGAPLGWVYIYCRNLPVVSVERLQEAIKAQLSWNLITAKLGETIVAKRKCATSLPPISVIVCTHDRAHLLQCCLQALTTLDYPEYEVVVIDHAPANELAARLAAQLGVRYVREDRPGLNWARNRGLAEARHDLIVYTHDDTRADRLWLKAIAAAFAKPEVMAMTGLIAPMELETDAQIYFEYTHRRMGKGLKCWEIRRSSMKKEQLLWASSFGGGANMAFRRELFKKNGLFDPALGVGTPARGGGDIEFFHRMVAGGHMLVYQPAAIVWHQNRREYDSLRRQLHDHSSGFAAYLLTCWRKRTVSRRAILRFAGRVWLWREILTRLVRPKEKSRHLVLAELQGMLKGCMAYRQALRQAKRWAQMKPEEPAVQSKSKDSAAIGGGAALPAELSSS